MVQFWYAIVSIIVTIPLLMLKILKLSDTYSSNTRLFRERFDVVVRKSFRNALIQRWEEIFVSI